MAKESSSAPPKSVIISPGVSHEVAEQPNQGVHITTSQEHITNFHRIRSQKPDANLSVIGSILFVLPIIILFFSNDILDMIPICCLFLLIGFVLVLINSSQNAYWNKEMKKAREEIERSEKIPYPAVNQWPQIAALFSLIGGFIAEDYDGIFLLLGGIVCLGFVLYYRYLTYRRDKIFDAVIDQLK
ncbi:MAG: Uncharacterised protein [Candidatus Poseidoniaceae archaeon]|nr:MAG: Uncharacterised protein [Candidatus Poseidoniaceae archaeon]